MTIATPTQSDGPVAAGDALPAGLPDVADLAALASQLFRALPGNGELPAGLPTGIPGGAVAPALPVASLPQEGTPASTSLPATPGSPRLAPAAAVPSGLPDTVAETLPVGGPGGLALGVPEAYAAALPSTQTAPVEPPASPFYFLAEANSQAPRPSGHASSPALPEILDANPYALPGGHDLRDLLAEVVQAPGSREPAVATPGLGGPAYYFIEPGLATQSVSAIPASAHPALDVGAIRRDFPILSERVNGRPLVWFDNAATTQKPKAVIDRLSWFYEHENSNIHRAAHEMAARATDAYESARKKITRFLGASSVEEIIFVRGATEGINLIAQTFGKQFIGEGDEIVVSHLEHHANIVPWQQIAAEKGARIRVIPVDDSGQILLEEYRKLLNDRTKIVAVTQVSNALGTVTPIQDIVALAHGVGALALVDGAQSVSHMRVNVQALDADFFVFSGHKVFGPTGIGVIYGKKALLDKLPPWQGGGNMIQDVTFERTLYHAAPARFEAGTGNIADAVGLGAALDYVEKVGIENIAQYEHDLLVYATDALRQIPGVRPIGTAKDKASVLSFVLTGYSTDEVGQALNREGIAVRTGHHCAQPILRRFGVEATVRPSLAFYNTCEEVDRMMAVLRRLARS